MKTIPGGRRAAYLGKLEVTGLRLRRKYDRFTMVPKWEFADNVRLAVDTARRVDGDVVECGTWKGGMSAAIAEAVKASGAKHLSVLFDSFEGIPAPKAVDGTAAAAWSKDTSAVGYWDNLRADIGEAQEAMRMAGVTARIEKGFFEDTVPAYAAEGRPIAILRLDGDWYDSTMVCLEHLFPLVTPGGIVIIDDYAIWDGCTRAVHEYLARTPGPEAIFRSPFGVPFIRRRRPDASGPAH